MATKDCGDAGVVPGMAAELFHLASLLVGDGDRALHVIERSLATMEIDPCMNPASAREQARACIVRESLAELAQEQPAAFNTSTTESMERNPCIQDDDLQAAGITPAELRSWLEQQAKPELRRGLRNRLEELPLVQRAIFVQRAVLGQGNEAAATLLRETGGPQARGWTSQNVSDTFRQALCSLANSLAHASAAEPIPA